MVDCDEWGQPHICVPLCSRRLRQREAAEVLNPHRQVCAEGTRDRCAEQSAFVPPDRDFAQLISLHGSALYQHSENRLEFVGDPVPRLLKETAIETALSISVRHWHNGVDESFNGEFRVERLNL